MGIVTTNLLNRFWEKGVKPIREALNGKLDTSQVVESTEITESGFVMDGKTASEEFAKLNSNFKKESGKANVPSAVLTKACTVSGLEPGLYLINAGGAYDISTTESCTMAIVINNTILNTVRNTMAGGGQMCICSLANITDRDTISVSTYNGHASAVNFNYNIQLVRLR